MDSYDVVVVGGGAAGLSGALTLARARRSVLVVDDGTPRNAPSDGVHNYLGSEGIPPGELMAQGRREVAGYGGTVTDDRVVAAARGEDGFTVALADGTSVGARRLLVTTGLVDELPAVEGLAQRWGREVLHCPYCHGWEVRDRAVAVLGTGPFSVHQAQLFRQWSADVTLFLHTAPPPDDEARRALHVRGITVVEGEVAALEVTDDGLPGLRMRSGETLACDAVVVAPRFVARSEVLVSLGLEAVDQEMGGHVFGRAVPAGPSGETTVPGVFVAGNVTDVRAGVINAAAAGFAVAAAVNADLVDDDVRRALAAHAGPGHDDTDGLSAEEFWEDRYRSEERVWNGHVNPVLLDVAGTLEPGAALDLGCGEGGDAVWLAARGWDVTAVDVSATAVARTAEHAADAGVGDRVRAERHDLAVSRPEGAYDLVSAQYLQSPLAFPRTAILRHLAGQVRPGGLLLLVDHGSVAPWSWYPDARVPTPEDLLAELDLDPTQWVPERLDAPERKAVGPGGQRATVVDTVVAVRRAG